MAGSTPIVVTGGDTAHGEVVRGDVLLIHYDNATDDRECAEEFLKEAIAADAPREVIESLEEILDKHDDEV